MNCMCLYYIAYRCKVQEPEVLYKTYGMTMSEMAIEMHTTLRWSTGECGQLAVIFVRNFQRTWEYHAEADKNV